MPSLLERLAALRARRETPETRSVDPELAAAAAKAGAPTRGTWDADYARRLKGKIEDSDSDSEGEIVVLPPPVVKLDPIAAREQWKKDMLNQASGWQESPLTDDDDSDGGDDDATGFEPIVDEEALLEAGDESPEAEVKEEDDVEDEDDNEGDGEDNGQDGANEKDTENIDAEDAPSSLKHTAIPSEVCKPHALPGACEQPPNAVAISKQSASSIMRGRNDSSTETDDIRPVFPDCPGRKKASCIRGVDKTKSSSPSEEETEHSQGDKQVQTALPCVTDFASKSATDETIKQVPCVLNNTDRKGSNSTPENTRCPSSSTQYVEVSCEGEAKEATRTGNDVQELSAVNTLQSGWETSRAHSTSALEGCDLVEDRAEDEDGDSSSDASEDDSGEPPEDPEGTYVSEGEECQTPGQVAAFHRQWEKAADKAMVRQLASGVAETRFGALIGDDDDAMELTATPEGQIENQNTCNSGDVATSGPMVDDDEPDMYMPATRTEAYVESMFRMRDEDNIFAGDMADEFKTLTSDRKTRAVALWRERQRRNVAPNGLEPVNLSRCGFLEDDTDAKRREIQLRIEGTLSIPAPSEVARDVGLANSSSDPFEANGPGRNHAPARATAKKTTKSYGVMPEWEKRRACLNKKEAHRRRGTAIGKWAYSSDGPQKSSSAAQASRHRPSAISSEAPTNARLGVVSNRHKRKSLETTEIKARAKITTSKHVVKRRKVRKSCAGLLDALDGRPQGR